MLHQRLVQQLGPIPARAGQPTAGSGTAECSRAYPRSRGATILSQFADPASKGLSPLARGNLQWCARLVRPGGPIPARAGQPERLRARGGPVRAYPRSRGATVEGEDTPRQMKGLSPLARGNHLGDHFFGLPQGPIPARAGQPWWPGRCSDGARAYPRSRGATVKTIRNNHQLRGLSPLARGNQIRGAREQIAKGPIPARAGQPQPRPRMRATTWAYPRSRGATTSAIRRAERSTGLSPLARGNPR